jgi:competence ComEA-like helix-hairpin-helix protein
MDIEGMPSSPPLCLNTASASELQRMRGLGAVLSTRIVTYRDTHGPFSSLEDLTAVPGIGRAMLRRLAPHLTIAVPPTLTEGQPRSPSERPADGTDAVSGNALPDPALMKGSHAMGIDRPDAYREEGNEPTPAEGAEERIPEVPPVEGVEPEGQEPPPSAQEPETGEPTPVEPPHPAR